MKSKNFISILIPVYKEPKLLEDIIERILDNNYKEKEILVGIDGKVTSELKNIIDKYSDKIFVYSDGIRRGKPKLLNYLSSLAKGDVFLFLDNDVELPEDKNFLSKLNDLLNKYDIVELPKEAIVGNFISRLISYDFLISAVLCYIVSKFFKTNLFLSGAAFGIRKKIFEEIGKFSEVINEDWDLMLKAFRLRKKYFFAIDLKVKTVVPSNLKEWIMQRIRWSLGVNFWWKEVFKDIKQFVRGLPIIFNIILFCCAPLVLGLIIKEFVFLVNLFRLLFYYFDTSIKCKFRYHIIYLSSINFSIAFARYFTISFFFIYFFNYIFSFFKTFEV